MAAHFWMGRAACFAVPRVGVGCSRAVAPRKGIGCSQGLLLLGQGLAVCEAAFPDRGRLLTGLIPLVWWWASRSAAPHMWVGLLHSCCSWDGGELHIWLLFVQWVWAVCGLCSLDRGGLFRVTTPSDVGRLLLLGWGQAAHEAGSPQMEVSCMGGYCSSDGEAGRIAAALRMGTGCLHSCCSSDGGGLLTRLLLFRQV